MTESEVETTLLSDYFGWVEENAGQAMTRARSISTAATPPTTEREGGVVLDFAPNESKQRRSWLPIGAAAACLAILVVGLVVAQRDEPQSVADQPVVVPYDPQRSGWFRIDLDGFEVVEPAVVDEQTPDDEIPFDAPTPRTGDPDIQTWTFAQLDADPVQWLGVTTVPADGAPSEYGSDEAVELTDVPDGRAWLLQQSGVTSGPDLSWTRDDGTIVLAYATNVELAEIAEWTFAALEDPDAVKIPADSGLLDITATSRADDPMYFENVALDGIGFSAMANPAGLGAFAFFGFDSIEPEMIGGIAGYRLLYDTAEPSATTLVWPMHTAGYWAMLVVPPELADRVGEIASAVVMTPEDPTVVFSITNDPAGISADEVGPSTVLYADRRVLNRDGDQWRLIHLDTDEFAALKESIDALPVGDVVKDANAADIDSLRIITSNNDPTTSVTINATDGPSAEQEPYALVAKALEALFDNRDSTLLTPRSWIVTREGSNDQCIVKEPPAGSVRPALPSDQFEPC